MRRRQDRKESPTCGATPRGGDGSLHCCLKRGHRCAHRDRNGAQWVRRPLLKLRPIPDAAVRRRGHTVTLTLAELRTVSAIVDEWIAGTRLDARTARSALRKLAAAGGTTYRGAE